MDAVQFQNEIDFEIIKLEEPRLVVLYSFIVQKSLTYLDLSACDYTHYRKPVFTEEQCRKFVEPKRQILYTYHLDLPAKMEHSLRAVTPSLGDLEQYSAFHLGEMSVCECLYTRNLARCLIHPIMSAINKVEKLRRYLNVMKLLKFNQSRSTAMLLFDNLILALYPYCSDSNLVVEFATTFGFRFWLFCRESPALVAYVLYHAVQIRYNIFQGPESGLDPINGCIVFRTPANVGMLLAYGTVLRFQPEIYLQELGRPLARRILRRARRRNISYRRFYLMLQFLYYFTFNNHYCYGLIFIWRSIPDPCLSENEIRLLFGNIVSSRTLQDMIEFYKFFIIEETDEMDIELPRPLQHLCRIAIRRALIRNFQLPNGIFELVLPRLIRDYLILKC